MNIAVPVWFDGPQFCPKSTKKETVNGYEGDLEKTEKILPPALKKSRKSKQINVISEQVPYKKKILIYLLRVANGNIYLSLGI